MSGPTMTRLPAPPSATPPPAPGNGPPSDGSVWLIRIGQVSGLSVLVLCLVVAIRVDPAAWVLVAVSAAVLLIWSLVVRGLGAN